MSKKDVWLVTGSNGFLGHHVIKQLLAKKERVIALDNLSWGHKGLWEDKDFFCQVDLRDNQKVRDVIREYRPNKVIHLAALHFIPLAMKDPQLALDINVSATQSLLLALREEKCDLDTFWFASTGDVYGPLETPLHEEDTPKAPFNIYGLSKLMGEMLISHEARFWPKARFIIGRLFNLYGSGETNPHILPEIIGQLKKSPDQALRLGNIWPKRDMVPVDEAANACIVMCQKAAELKNNVSTFNLATGMAYSMEELIQKIGQLRNKNITVEKDPQKVRSVERAHLQANVEHLKKFIGEATPSGNLERGLKKLLIAEGMLADKS